MLMAWFTGAIRQSNLGQFIRLCVVFVCGLNVIISLCNGDNAEAGPLAVITCKKKEKKKRHTLNEESSKFVGDWKVIINEADV